MVETLKAVLGTLLLLFQSRSRLQVEIMQIQRTVIATASPREVQLLPGSSPSFTKLSTTFFSNLEALF